MKIKYDRRLKVVGLGVSPWPRIGPERWFDEYKIASFYNWDMSTGTVPEVISLKGRRPKNLLHLNTQSLLRSRAFQSLLVSSLNSYKILTYKPINFDTPKLLRDSNLHLMQAQSSISLENKAVFRRKFDKVLPFPRFEIYKLSSMPNLSRILNGLGPIVLQHETLSGSKGTFIVRSYQEFQRAIKILQSKNIKREVIVSEYIENAREIGVQCCATRHGIFVSYPHKQLVKTRELLNPTNILRDKFCGAEISYDNHDRRLYGEMSRHCKLIGQELLRSGYRGVFGVDFLYSEEPLSFLSPGYTMGSEDKVLLQSYTPAGANVLPSGKLAIVFFKSKVLNDRDELVPEVKKIIKGIYNKIELKTIA